MVTLPVVVAGGLGARVLAASWAAANSELTRLIDRATPLLGDDAALDQLTYTVTELEPGRRALVLFWLPPAELAPSTVAASTRRLCEKLPGDALRPDVALTAALAIRKRGGSGRSRSSITWTVLADCGLEQARNERERRKLIDTADPRW